MRPPNGLPSTNSGDPERPTRGCPLFHKTLSLTPFSLTSSGRVRESVLEETCERNQVPLLPMLRRSSACCQAADSSSGCLVAVSPLLIVAPRASSRRDPTSRGTRSVRICRRSQVGAGPIRIDRGTAEILEPAPRRESAPVGGCGQCGAKTSSRTRSATADFRLSGSTATRNLVSLEVFAPSALAPWNATFGVLSHSSASGSANRSDPRPPNGKRPPEISSGLPRSAAHNAARKARHAKRNVDERPPTGGKPDRHR